MDSIEIATNLAKMISELKIATKVANLKWMEDNIQDIYEGRKKRKLLEMDFQREIERKKADLDQEWRLLELEYEGELKKFKMKVERDIKGYEDFLNALDEMQSQFILDFKDVPPVMALLIHRHASELLNQMWNEGDPIKREALRVKFLDVLSNMAADVMTLKASEDGTYFLPERTLKLIKGD